MALEFKDYSVEVKEAINGAIVAYLYEVAGELESQTKRNTPVDNGQLKSSWDYKVYEHKGEAVIGSPLQNAIWNEFGTGDYAVKGDGRKTAWYVPVDGYTGAKKPTYKGKVIVVHGKNGKTFYKTDGKHPNRTLQKSFDSTKKKAVEVLKSKLRGLK